MPRVRRVVGVLARLALALPALALPVLAETPVTEDIRDNRTWTVTGSPYHVTGIVSVYGNGGTVPLLNIEAGVQVIFDSGSGLQIGKDGEHGAIAAVGGPGPGEEVVFTTANPSPAAGQWRGLYFSADASSTTCRLEKCVVEYAGQSAWGLGTYAGVQVNGTSPQLVDCVVRSNVGHGLYWVLNDSSEVNILGGEVSYNRDVGLYVTGVAGAAFAGSVDGTQFRQNGKQGILAGGTGWRQFDVLNCTFRDNGLTPLEAKGTYLAVGGCDIGCSVSASYIAVLALGEAPTFYVDNTVDSSCDGKLLQPTAAR